MPPSILKPKVCDPTRSVPRWRYPLIEIQVSSPNNSSLSKNHPNLHSKTTTSTPKIFSHNQNISSNPPPLHPSAHQIRIENPICEWKNPLLSTHVLLAKTRKKPHSTALFPADLLDFRPYNHNFVWNNPLCRCVSTYLYVLKKKTGGKDYVRK